jgi:hypothetical protein
MLPVILCAAALLLVGCGTADEPLPLSERVWESSEAPASARPGKR